MSVAARVAQEMGVKLGHEVCIVVSLQPFKMPSISFTHPLSVKSVFSFMLKYKLSFTIH